MNTLSSLLEWIANTIGANPSTLKTTSKTLVGSINEIADKVYPVGCYYWTSDGTFNPQTAFGGTWEKMDEGMTLVSAGNTYTVSAGTSKDGGSKDAVVVSHNHTSANAGYHRHIAASRRVDAYKGDGNLDALLYYGYTTNYDYTSYDGTHNHTINTTGVDGTDKNMPPYKNAFCWHRTA